MDLNAWVNVNFFSVEVNSQTAIGHCGLIPLQVFFMLISICIKGLLILHTIFQPNIPSRSVLEKMVILIVLLFLVMAAILNSRPD